MQYDWSEAAAVADYVPIVRARIIEAADTFKHLGVRGLTPNAPRSCWPEIILDYKEVRARYRPDAAAISRAEEVFYDWIARKVTDDQHRVVLGQWAASRVGASQWGSFRNFCDKTQPNRRTPQRWVDAEILSLAVHFRNSPQSLHEPDWVRVSPFLRVSATENTKIKSPAFERPDTSVPGGLQQDFNDPEVVEAMLRADHLSVRSSDDVEREERRRQATGTPRQRAKRAA